jgi:hypothetical protein
MGTVPLKDCVQYEMVGYLGMVLCAVYLAACFYLLWEMSRNRKFSNQKDLQKIILILLILFNGTLFFKIAWREIFARAILIVFLLSC